MTTLRTLLYDPDTNTLQSGGEELIARWQSQPATMLWLDLHDVPADRERALLMENFGLHVYAIQDAQRSRHPPKLEVFDDDTVFLLLKGLDAASKSIDFGTIQIAMFIGKSFLVTRHNGDSLSINTTWQALTADPSGCRGGPAALAVALSGRIADRFLPILLELEQRLEVIEDEMFANPRDALLEELIGYKTQLRKLKRICKYHERVFSSLRADDIRNFGRALHHDLVNLYEHAERQHSLSELYYELATDMIEGYISVASHRLNQIMKVLTIITAIFVPLSFLAGIYGMNFENMPELHSSHGYFMLLGLMAAIATLLLYVFRRKEWI